MIASRRAFGKHKVRIRLPLAGEADLSTHPLFGAAGLGTSSAEAAQSAGFVLLFPLVFASPVFVPASNMPSWLQAFAKVSPVTLTADAAWSLALILGTPSSLGGAIACIAGLLTVFIPLSVWRYRRMT